MGIGVAIEEHRIKTGLSKQELANMLNVTYQDVSKWENDEVEPTYEWLVKISEALECSVDELFEFRPVDSESSVEKRRKNDVKKRRINSFVFPLIVSVALVILGVTIILNENILLGVSCFIFAIFLYTFIACLILDNNFIADIWFKYASIGFEKLRDAFLEFTAKPFTIFWTLEIFGFVLGSIVGVILIIFATALGFFTSVVIYPYAIVQNIKYS